LVWLKSRGIVQDHGLIDTVRGATKFLRSNTTAAEATGAATLTSFNANGFSIGATFNSNTAPATYTSWTFREQPKFFDIVTYTGNGVSGRQIAHNLGSTPGCMIIKGTNTVDNWPTYHRSLSTPVNNALILNGTNAALGGGFWTAVPTSTVFSLSADSAVNVSGNTYVAYLFAHDAGGFGLTGTDNVISCGSAAMPGSGSLNITLGYEPQFIIIKQTNSTGDWFMFDALRDLSLTNNNALKANLSSAESSVGVGVSINSTGFSLPTAFWGTSPNTFIYIAIRRGPMKVPTLGTSVFSPVTRTGTGATATGTAGFAPDLIIPVNRPHDATGATPFFDKLRGSNQAVYSNSTSVEETRADTLTFSNTGVTFGTNAIANSSGASYVNWNFRRAPGFFDEVCYTGTGAGTYVINHSLGVVPTFMIFKQRSVATEPWFVELPSLGFGLELNNNSANHGPNLPTPTATTITSNDTRFQASGVTYVAYLFATCLGVSKVGSYTGNGSSQTIACGFTSGARFVMIKRTDSTGDWYVWDTARGIVSGNDPHLSLNTTAAEVTTDDTIDPDNSGFIVNQVAATNVNVSSATYIFLAIA
jgi:hypothetical protein